MTECGVTHSDHDEGCSCGGGGGGEEVLPKDAWEIKRRCEIAIKIRKRNKRIHATRHNISGSSRREILVKDKEETMQTQGEEKIIVITNRLDIPNSKQCPWKIWAFANFVQCPSLVSTSPTGFLVERTSELELVFQAQRSNR